MGVNNILQFYAQKCCSSKPMEHEMQILTTCQDKHESIRSFIVIILIHQITYEGAQWLSGRILDSRPKGCGSSLTGVIAVCH